MLLGNKPKYSSEFINQLTNDIESLEKLILDEQLENFDRIGAEQEFCLIDENFRANPINETIVKKIKKHGFVTEIAKFNMELNIEPINLLKNSLRKMEEVLCDKMKIAEEIAQKHNADIILTGILPTVRKYDLRFANITNNQRYYDLCNAISESRGQKYKIRISGLDELIFQHDSPLIEGCNTGFQFHLQIDPKIFHKMYNFAQLIAAPVLATSVNSPMLFGKRLWNETRIAVFQQATDTRIIGNYHLESLPRVTFGNSWLKKSLIEIFKEDITRYKILLKSLSPKEYQQRKTKLPKLKALSLHNSTVYRWNRPCYGIYNKKPSIRIENRMLPAGPTIIDEIANSAFWLGLLMFFKNSELDLSEKNMKFDDARINFYAAAQQGIDATFKWFNKRIDARKLILNELIPKAAIGLSSININPKDIDKYLSIIKNRTTNRQNGARWIIDAYDQLSTKFSKQNTLTTITSEIIRNQKENKPVHKWELPKHSVVINNPSELLIEECMERDINSINEDDTFELAYQINQWNKTNYMVVVNKIGQIKGLLTKNIFESEKNIKERKDTRVKQIMKKKIKTVKPDTNIQETIAIMYKHNLETIPVVEDKLFLGIIQKKKLLQYDQNNSPLSPKIDLSENYERVIGNYHSNNEKTVIFIAAIHGNETSGVTALNNFFNHIKHSNIKIEGTVIGMIGNLKAIKNKKRYIDTDMNRIWQPNYFLNKPKRNYSEEKELIMLKSSIDKVISLKKKKNICIVDLHNTSSSNGVFTIVNNLTESKIASSLNIPRINNLFPKVKGSMAEYYHSKGVRSIVFEGGAIGDPASINNHEAGIWKILENQQLIKSINIPNDIRRKSEKMASFSKHVNGNYKVVYIHKIQDNDQFLMNPNMQNFEDIKKGQIIAHDKNGSIKSPQSGKLLMPLYKEQGKEGFYIIK